ncbi:MAG: sodium/solute symporter [Cellulosilyticum sp.]|nr:sodium/solute symporter [Cellulosilyticum sp.]
MVGVGIYSKRKVKSSNDFLLGGRNMGGWVSAFAYGTSYFSAVIFIGYAGAQGWEFGVPITWIGICNGIFGCYLAWKVLAKRTRQMTQRLDARTMPEFFEKRYDSRNMKFVSALIIFIFLVPYTASVYKGLGYILQSSFNISFNLAIFFMALLTAVYLLLGGYVATAINDLIQGVIMLVGCVLMVLYVVNHPNVGGLSEGFTRLNQLDPDLTSIFSGGSKTLPLIGLIIMTSFGVWGLPQMIHKYYAIKDETAIKKGTIISTIFALIIGGSAYFTGSLGRLFFIDEASGVAVMPGATVEAADSGMADMIIPIMLESTLPTALMGIIIVLILSASMSTLASLVLVSSSTISIDFVKGFVNPKMSDKAMMIMMRVFCFIFVAVSYLLAVEQSSTIVSLMSLSWGVISGMFLGPYVFGIWWRKTTKLGAWSGFVVGGLVMIGGTILSNEGMLPSAITGPVISSLAMLASCISVPVVSLLSAQMSEGHISKAFGEEKSL